jgi:phytoene desaturase
MKHAADLVAAARRAQLAWDGIRVSERLALIRRVRGTVVEAAEELEDAVESSHHRGPGETLAAEVLPLAEACRFLERRAERILAPKRLRAGLRFLWSGGTRAQIRREPWGVVLIIGPSNYPLLLPGVQAVQALVAGNAAVWKPGATGEPVARAFVRLLTEAGLDPALCPVLDESVDAAKQALAAGPDKVVLTGSVRSGRAVLGALAEQLVPATMELSGCDAMFVRPGADLALVQKAIRFGMRLNHGATCLAPHRVFVREEMADELERRLAEMARAMAPAMVPLHVAAFARRLAREATEQGARLLAGSIEDGEPFSPIILGGVKPEMKLVRQDVFAPVLSILRVADDADALRQSERCPYALGATVFGERHEAELFATCVPAGGVIVNDIIAPTGDPRVPFGGWNRSGYGVTRGEEGLLEMTRVKVVQVPRGWFRPHLDPPTDQTRGVVRGLLAARHAATWKRRVGGWLDTIRALRGSPQNDEPAAEARAKDSPDSADASGSAHRSDTTVPDSGEASTVSTSSDPSVRSTEPTSLPASPRRVAIVGGGLGGLAAACTLAARGHDVTLFERNEWVGGKACVLESDGFRFDMGPTILSVPSVLRRVFAEAGKTMEDELELVALDPQWRCFFNDNSRLDLVADVGAMAESLERWAPGSGLGDGYRRFSRLAETLYGIADRYFFYRPIGSFWDMFRLESFFRTPLIADVFRMRLWSTVAGTVRKFLREPRVAQMADHFTQYVGSSPYLAPAMLCSIAHMQTSEGIWYPMGGTRAVPVALERLARELGVTVHTGTPVQSITAPQDRATGLVAGGRGLQFDAVVSNCDTMRTHAELLTHSPMTEKELRHFQPACSGVVLYLGLDRKYEQLSHHNFVFSQDPEEEFDAIYDKGEPAPDPTCYVCAPSLTEPAVAPDGGEALYILVHAPHLRRDHDWPKMLPEYRRVILDKMARTAGCSDIEKHIVFEAALTPVDIRDRYITLKGAIYGLASHGRLTGAVKPSNRSPHVRNLYFGGGSANPGPGMPMALMSGWIAADALDQDARSGRL